MLHLHPVAAQEASGAELLLRATAEEALLLLLLLPVPRGVRRRRLRVLRAVPALLVRLHLRLPALLLLRKVEFYVMCFFKGYIFHWYS